MPIDPSIPLGSRPVAQDTDPFGMFSKALGLRNAMTQIQTNQLEMQGEQEKLAALKQTRADDVALRTAVQAVSSLDPGKTPDWELVAQHLDMNGNAPVAQKVRLSALEQRTKVATTMKDEADTLGKNVTLASQIARGIDPADVQSWQRGKSAITALLGDNIGNMLGDTPDPKRLNEAISWGTTARDQIAAHNNMLNFAMKAMELSQTALRDTQTAEKNAPEIEANWKRAIASAAEAVKLSPAGDRPAAWEKMKGYFGSNNMDPVARRIVADLSPVYSDTALNQAIQLGLTPKETADIDRQKELTAQGWVGVGLERERNKIAQDRLGAEMKDVPNLSPEGLDLVARNFAMTGNLPPMGMGAATVRTQIINRAADLYKGLDIASQQAAFKANQVSLSRLTPMLDAVTAFENTALKNVTVFEDQAKKVIDTGSPWLNAPLRLLADKALGSAEQAAYDTARTVVIPEFARIIGNPSLTGNLTDAMREEVDRAVKGEATLKQIYSTIGVLKKDAANRHEALSAQIDAVVKRIASPPGEAGGLSNADSGSNKAGTPAPDVIKRVLASKGAGDYTIKGPSGIKKYHKDATGNVTEVP